MTKQYTIKKCCNIFIAEEVMRMLLFVLKSDPCIKIKEYDNNA